MLPDSVMVTPTIVYGKINYLPTQVTHIRHDSCHSIVYATKNSMPHTYVIADVNITKEKYYKDTK